ncbi:MAG TPA: long-chain fatty acid--CoA ligase [Jatrophihabitantaceae bacterium]|nr:long-chain fatty acid--CoA ligase [Jatrophihabitantaceae bacterium]
MTTSLASREKVDLSVIENRAPSVARLFLDRVAATPASEAFRFPSGDSWASVSWSQVGDRVRRQAAGLIALGVEREQPVAVASTTRYEWVLADLAIMCAGAATTTVYPTTTAEDVTFIISDSGSRVVFAEDDAQIRKLRDNRSQLPEVAKVVTTDGTSDGDWVISLAELERLGEDLIAAQPSVVDDRVAATTRDSLATLIYTSGTTGRPKGVRLLHSAWTYEAASVDSVSILRADDLQYLWLPLSHVFGKVLLTLPLQIGFPTAIDGRVDKIVDNLAVVRPTFMGAAPRIFEKAHARIVALGHGEGGIKARIFDWAFDVGIKVVRARQAGDRPSAVLMAQYAVADRLVFRKIRERFGGRLRFFISGSAALNRDVAEWFDAAGILILEGYGMTESSAATFVNRPSEYLFGTVGHPLPGTEFRIAEDGEVLVKGPGVMAGYHNQDEATSEALDADGWLRTGDIGEVAPNGALRITDRKKDMFKTSNGKYVAPSAIDATFKGISPYVSHLVVDGEGRSYCVALIALDADAARAWANENGMGGAPFGVVARSDKFRATMQADVDRLNSQLNRWESIKKFAILDRELTVDDGEITPSMKVRRKIVLDRYRSTLDTLYGD